MLEKLQILYKKNFKGDPVIWLIMFAMAIISLVAVYSSTSSLAYAKRGGDTSYFLMRHAFFLMAGFTVAWFTHKLHYRRFLVWARFLMPFAILLLVVTLAFGQDLNGASRWLIIPGIGIQFQPSELAKYIAVMFIAMQLGINQTSDRPPQRAMLTIMVWLGIVIFLIITQNLSTALLIGAVTVAMMLVGRVPLRYVLGLALISSTLLIGVIAADLSSDKFEIERVNTWLGRVKPILPDWEVFEAVKATEAGDSFQGDMAKVAVSTGGIFGKGPGNSDQKHILPHPYSDFLYALIIEEGGMIFGILVLLFYFIILYRTAMMVKQCKSTFPAFLSIGLGMTIFLQAFIHMGVSVGLGPVTGQTLPLMSMGGTSIIFTSFAFGMIQSVSRFSNETEPVPDDNEE